MSGKEPIKLVVNGLTIPAFKNKKRAIMDRNTGRMRTMTDAKTQRQMEEITHTIALLLASVIPMPDDAISMEQHLQSWIASSLPLDDSRQWIAELLISSQDVDKGNEGVDIIIQPLLTTDAP